MMFQREQIDPKLYSKIWPRRNTSACSANMGTKHMEKTKREEVE